MDGIENHALPCVRSLGSIDLRTGSQGCLLRIRNRHIRGSMRQMNQVDEIPERSYVRVQRAWIYHRGGRKSDPASSSSSASSAAACLDVVATGQ